VPSALQIAIDKNAPDLVSKALGKDKRTLNRPLSDGFLPAIYAAEKGAAKALSEAGPGLPGGCCGWSGDPEPPGENALRESRACSWTVSIYTYYLDAPTFFGFNLLVKTALPIPTRYRRLAHQLADLGYLSQGSVLQRPASQQGSRFIWTRKVRGKTVTVALSEEQFHWLRKAVANQRTLDRIVNQMRALSHEVLFSAVPGVPRRKRLSKKVLGTI